MLLIDLVIDVSPEFWNNFVDAVVLVGGFVAWAGNNQRGACFVNQDGVDFVDDGEMVAPLHPVRDVELHVVAKVVEAELVVCSVSDIGVIGLSPIAFINTVVNHTDRHSKELVEAPHPLGVAFGQIVVDGDNVNALAFKSVQVCRQCGDQRLSFTGLHLRDSAFMQSDASDELNIEMTHVQDALARFAHHCEGFRNEIVQRLAVCNALPEFCGFGLKVGVRES